MMNSREAASLIDTITDNILPRIICCLCKLSVNGEAHSTPLGYHLRVHERTAIDFRSFEFCPIVNSAIEQ